MQIVGYSTGAPALLVSTNDGIDSVALTLGTELDYRLGDRHCAGTIHDDRHVACNNTRTLYCSDHRHTWVCVKCTETCLKDKMDCHEGHVVYFAAFAPNTFRVGVTHGRRLDARLREQGADRAAHIRTFPDGRITREYEAGLATEVTDRVRVPAKIEGFGRAVNATAWDAPVARFDPIETFAFDYGLDLVGSPVAKTAVTGTIRGVKGRVLALGHRGMTYAVDVHDLVGYELGDDRADCGLQSSLGAFG